MSTTQLSNHIRALLTTYRNNPVHLLSPTIWSSITTTLTNEVICDINLDPAQLFQIIQDTFHLTLTTPISLQIAQQRPSPSTSTPQFDTTHLYLIFNLCEVLFSSRYEASFAPSPNLLLEQIIKLYELYIDQFGSFFTLGPEFVSICLDFLQLLWTIWHFKLEQWSPTASTSISSTLSNTTTSQSSANASSTHHRNRLVFDALMHRVVKLHAHLFSLLLAYIQLAAQPTPTLSRLQFSPSTSPPLIPTTTQSTSSTPKQPQIDHTNQSVVDKQRNNIDGEDDQSVNSSSQHSTPITTLSPFLPFFTSFQSFLHHEQNVCGISQSHGAPSTPSATAAASSHFTSPYQHQFYNGLSQDYQNSYQSSFDKMYTHTISPTFLSTMSPHLLNYLSTIAFNQFCTLSSQSHLSETRPAPLSTHQNLSTDAFRSILSSISLFHSTFSAISLLYIFFFDATHILARELSTFYNLIILHGTQYLPTSYKPPTSIDADVSPLSIEFKVKSQFSQFTPPIAFSQLCPMLLLDSLPVVNTTLQLISLPQSTSQTVINTMQQHNGASTTSQLPSFLKYAQSSPNLPYSFETITTFLRSCFCSPVASQVTPSGQANSTSTQTTPFLTLHEHIHLYRTPLTTSSHFPLVETPFPINTDRNTYRPSKHYPTELSYHYFPFWWDLILTAIRHYYNIIFDNILDMQNDQSLLNTKPQNPNNSSTSPSLFSLEAKTSPNQGKALNMHGGRRGNRSVEDELAIAVQEVYRDAKDHLFLVETVLSVIALTVYTSRTPIVHLQHLKNNFTTKFFKSEHFSTLLASKLSDAMLIDVSKALLSGNNGTGKGAKTDNQGKLLTDKTNKSQASDDKKSKSKSTQQPNESDENPRSISKITTITASSDIIQYYNFLEYIPQAILTAQMSNLNTLLSFFVLGNNIYTASKDRSLSFFSLLQAIIINLAYSLATTTFNHAFPHPASSLSSTHKQYYKKLQNHKQALLSANSMRSSFESAAKTPTVVRDLSTRSAVEPSTSPETPLFTPLSTLVELSHTYAHILSYITSLEHHSYLHEIYPEKDKMQQFTSESDKVYFQSISYANSIPVIESTLKNCGIPDTISQSQQSPKIGLVSTNAIVLANSLITKYIGSTTDHSLYAQIYQVAMSVYNNSFYTQQCGTYGHSFTKHGSYINPFFSSWTLVGEALNTSGIIDPTSPDLIGDFTTSTIPFSFSSTLTAHIRVDEFQHILLNRLDFTNLCATIIPAILLTILKLSPDVATNTLPLFMLIPTYLHELSTHQTQLCRQFASLTSASQLHTDNSRLISTTTSPPLSLHRYANTLLLTYCQLRQPQTLFRAYFQTASVLLLPQSIPPLARANHISIQYQPMQSMNVFELHLSRGAIVDFSIALSASILTQCTIALTTLTHYQQERLFSGLDSLLTLFQCEMKSDNSLYKDAWTSATFDQSTPLPALPHPDDMIEIELTDTKVNNLSTLLTVLAPLFNPASFPQCNLTSTITATLQQLAQHVTITHLDSDKYLPLLQQAQSTLYKTALVENLRHYFITTFTSAIATSQAQSAQAIEANAKSTKRSRHDEKDKNEDKTKPTKTDLSPSNHENYITQLIVHEDPYVLLIQTAYHDGHVNPAFNAIWSTTHSKQTQFSPTPSNSATTVSTVNMNAIYPLTTLISLCRTIHSFIKRAQDPIRVPTHTLFPTPILSTILFQPAFSPSYDNNNSNEQNDNNKSHKNDKNGEYTNSLHQFLTSTNLDLILPPILSQFTNKITSSGIVNNQLSQHDISSILIIADLYVQRCTEQSYCEVQQRGLITFGFDKTIKSLMKSDTKTRDDKISQYFTTPSVIQSFADDYLHSYNQNTQQPSQCGHITLIQSFITLISSLSQHLALFPHHSPRSAQIADLLVQLLQSSSPLFINLYQSISTCHCFATPSSSTYLTTTLTMLTKMIAHLILSPFPQIYTAIVQIVPLFDSISFILPQLSITALSDTITRLLTSPLSPLSPASLKQDQADSTGGNDDIEAMDESTSASNKYSKSTKKVKKATAWDDAAANAFVSLNAAANPVLNSTHNANAMPVSAFNAEQFRLISPFLGSLVDLLDSMLARSDVYSTQQPLLALWDSFTAVNSEIRQNGPTTTAPVTSFSLQPYQHFDQLLCFFANLPEHLFHHVLAAQYQNLGVYFVSILFMIRDTLRATTSPSMFASTPSHPQPQPQPTQQTQTVQLFATFDKHLIAITQSIASTTFPAFNTSKSQLPFTSLSTQFINLAYAVISTGNPSGLEMESEPTKGKKCSKKGSKSVTESKSLIHTSKSPSPTSPGLTFLYYFISNAPNTFFEQMVTTGLLGVKTASPSQISSLLSLYTSTYTDSSKYNTLVDKLRSVLQKDPNNADFSPLLPHIGLTTLLSQLNSPFHSLKKSPSPSLALLNTFIRAFCSIIAPITKKEHQTDSTQHLFAVSLFPILFQTIFTQLPQLLAQVETTLDDQGNMDFQAIDDFIISVSSLSLLYNHASQPIYQQPLTKHLDTAVSIFRNVVLFNLAAYLVNHHQYTKLTNYLPILDLISTLSTVDTFTGCGVPVFVHYDDDESNLNLMNHPSHKSSQSDSFSFNKLLPSSLRFICLLTIFIRQLQLHQQTEVYALYHSTHSMSTPINTNNNTSMSDSLPSPQTTHRPRTDDLSITAAISALETLITTAITRLVQTSSQTITTPYITSCSPTKSSKRQKGSKSSIDANSPMPIASVGNNIVSVLIIQLSQRFFTLNTPMHVFNSNLKQIVHLWSSSLSSSTSSNQIDSLIESTLISSERPNIDVSFQYQQFISMVSTTFIKSLYSTVFNQESGPFKPLRWYAVSKRDENDDNSVSDDEANNDESDNDTMTSSKSNTSIHPQLEQLQNDNVYFKHYTELLAECAKEEKNRKIFSIVYATNKPTLISLNSLLSSLLAYIPNPSSSSTTTISAMCLTSEDDVNTQPFQYQLQSILTTSTQLCINSILDVIALISKPANEGLKCLSYSVLTTIVDTLTLFNPYLTFDYHDLPSLRSSFVFADSTTNTLSGNIQNIQSTPYHLSTSTIAINFILHIFPTYTTILTHLPSHFAALPNNNNNTQHLSTPFQQHTVMYTTQLLAPALTFIFSTTNFLHNRISTYITQLSRLYTPSTHPIIASTKHLHTQQLSLLNAATHHFTKVLISISYQGAKKCIPYLILPMFNTYLTQYSLYSSQIVITATQSISFALSIILASIRIPDTTSSLNYIKKRSQQTLTDVDFIPTDLQTISQLLDPAGKAALQTMIKTATQFRFYR